MRKALLASVALALLCAPAIVSDAAYQPASQASVVASCGSAGYTAGTVENSTQTAGGNSCAQGAPVLDATPASGTIGAADTASTSTTGYNSVAQIVGTPTANSAVSTGINGQSTVTVQLTGTWSATVAFETSSDGGTTWTQATAMQRGSGAGVYSIVATGSGGDGSFLVVTGSATNVRVRATAYTSGTVTVKFEIAASASAVRLDPSGLSLAQGSATSGEGGSLVMGAVSTGAPSYTTGQTDPLSLDTAGNARVNVQAGVAIGATGSAVPGSAGYAGAVSSGNLTGIIQADNSAPISVSSATTTQLVALATGKKIYVTEWNVQAAGTGNFSFEYGTGTACGTGTTALTGTYNEVAQSGISAGAGLGPILIVPAGNALCIVTSAAVTYSGSVAYTQF